MEGIDLSKASPGDLPDGYKPLVGNLGKALESGDFSDLQIICGDVQWAVHKVIVCTQSDFFNACSKNFKEAEEGIIKLPDDNKHAVDALIIYLYKADYDDKLAMDANLSPLVLSVHVNTIADKYNIKDLAELAAAKIAKRATTEWNTPAFADAIEEMYKMSLESQKAMRKHMIDIAAEHIQELRTQVSGFRFREVSDAIAPFSAALLSRIVDVKPKQSPFDSVRIYRCPACDMNVFLETASPTFNTYPNCHHCASCNHISHWLEWESN